MDEGDKIISWIRKKEVKYSILKKRKRKLDKKVVVLKRDLEDFSKAKLVLARAIHLTQRNFKKGIEALMTKGVNTVYDRPFKFKLEYGNEGGKTIAQPIIFEGTNKQKPKEDMGVGTLDIISAAFRFVLWKLQLSQSDNFMWLDEPMRDLGHGELLIRSATFLREISKRMNFQLIINTHEPELSMIGDKIFNVVHNGKHSVVTSTSVTRKGLKL